MEQTTDELKQTFYFVAVSNNQESATNLLNSVFNNLQTTDSQEWTTKEGDYDVKCYIKYPDCDIHRRGPSFADFVISSVGAGDKEELDVLNYVKARTDARYRLLIDTTERNVEQNIKVVQASEVATLLKEYAASFKAFNEENKDIDATHYEEERRHFCLGGDSDKYKVFKKFFRGFRELSSIINLVEKSITDFNVDNCKWKSENVTKVNLTPEDSESNGVGIEFDLISGDEFTKENPHLPIVVRDNALTFTLEFIAKNPEGVDAIINTLETAKQMAAQFGALEQAEKLGATVSFSKEGTKVFFDITLGGILGEGILNRIRSFNLERFKFSLKDSVKIQTNLNLKELYEEPNLMSIITNLSKISIVGDGQLLNVRGLLHLIREFAKISKKDNDKKTINMVSYGLLILSTFENLGLEIKYNSEELKESGLSLAGTIMGLEEEGALDGMISGFSETYKSGMLPMGLETINQFKPFLEMFKSGLSEVDFDTLSAEIVIPVIRSEFKTTLILPGLTEFLSKNVLN